MIISGEGHVEEMIGEDLQLQPAGVDLTVGRVEAFTQAGRIDFDNSNREVASGRDVTDGKLSGGGAYRITYNEKISVPEDAAGFVFPRSTLLRNGCHLSTAVWDPGYRGKGQGLLLVFNPHGLYLEKNARVGQLVFFKLKSKSHGGYQGKFQNENL